jgi:Transcriptional repressor smtB
LPSGAGRAVCGVYEIHPERVERARAALPEEGLLKRAALLVLVSLNSLRLLWARV